MKYSTGFAVLCVLLALSVLGNTIQWGRHTLIKDSLYLRDMRIKSLEETNERQLAIVEQRIEFWKRSYDELQEKMYARQPAQEVVLTNPDYELVFILDGPLTVNHRWDLDVVYEPFDAAGRMFHGPIDRPSRRNGEAAARDQRDRFGPV